MRYVQLAVCNDGLTPVTVRPYVVRSERLIDGEWRVLEADHEVELDFSATSATSVELDHDITRHINVMSCDQPKNELHFETGTPISLHREFAEYGTYRLTVMITATGQASKRVVV